jgi:O-antigen ligase
MEKINATIRKVFLFLIAFFPWVNFALRKVPKLANVWDDLLILLFLTYAFFVYRRRIKQLINLPTFLFALLFASVSMVGFVLNDYMLLAFGNQFRLFLEPFAIFIAVYLIKPEKKEIDFYLKSFVLSSVLLALHGVYQYIMKVPTPSEWVDADLEASAIYTRAFSVVDSPNRLASYLILALPIPFIYLFERKKLLEKVFPLTSIAIIVVGLFLTFSRGGWIGGFGAMFLSFAFVNPVISISLIVLVSLIIFAVPVFRLRIFSFLDPSYIDKSLNTGLGRLFKWKYAITNGMEHPLFGTGLGTYGSVSASKYGISFLLDGTYISIFAETGFLGLIAFSFWIFYGVANYFANYFKTRKLIFLFLGASLISFLIHNLVESHLSVWGLTVNFWAITAIGEILNNE